MGQQNPKGQLEQETKSTCNTPDTKAAHEGKNTNKNGKRNQLKQQHMKFLQQPISNGRCSKPTPPKICDTKYSNKPRDRTQRHRSKTLPQVTV